MLPEMCSTCGGQIQGIHMSTTCVAYLKVRIESLEKLLVRILPDCMVCQEHGPFVKIDEDGCCTHCGEGATAVPSMEALKAFL